MGATVQRKRIVLYAGIAAVLVAAGPSCARTGTGYDRGPERRALDRRAPRQGQEHPRRHAPRPPQDRADVVIVRYRIERRTDDAASDGFARTVRATLRDERGWRRAGFRLVHRRAAEFRVVLAEGPEVDRLCRPYRTYGTYSCQNGPIVALNADRWRRATPQWTGTLHAYRLMLINHEVGHLLGQHHPEVQCAAAGKRAPIMAQQSTELDGCLPNSWPLPREIRRAARHDLPLAPPFQR